VQDPLIVEKYEIAVPEATCQLIAWVAQQFGETAVCGVETCGVAAACPQGCNRTAVVVHRRYLATARELNERTLGVEVGVF